MPGHPNATTAGAFGGLGTLLVWALGKWGVDLDPPAAAAIATGAAGVALFIGRNGIKGLARRIWTGTGTKS